MFERSMQGLQTCLAKYDFGVESKKEGWTRSPKPQRDEEPEEDLFS